MPQNTDPLKELKAFVAKYPTQGEAAAALGISRPYLFDLLHNNRRPSAAILAKLGLTRVERVVRLTETA